MNEEREFIRLMSEPMVSKRRVWRLVIILAVLFWACVGVVAWKVLS